MKTIIKILIVLIIAALFISCEKENDEKIANDNDTIENIVSIDTNKIFEYNRFNVIKVIKNNVQVSLDDKLSYLYYFNLSTIDKNFYYYLSDLNDYYISYAINNNTITFLMASNYNLEFKIKELTNETLILTFTDTNDNYFECYFKHYYNTLSK
jgi:hypothetical protein